MTFKGLIFVLVVLAACGDKKKMEIAYHENDQIEYEVPLIDGQRNGVLKEYYETGELKGFSTWSNGKLHGESKLFYKNGSLMQVNHHNHGSRCCESKFYSESEILREVQYFDDEGRLFDYEKFTVEGVRSTNLKSKSAIVIVEKDTLDYGETFKGFIRLGNREFNSIEVVLGDPSDRYILTNPKLPKADPLTGLLKIEETTTGVNTIKGVVVERDSTEGAELVIVPFEYSFYVRDNSVKS